MRSTVALLESETMIGEPRIGARRFWTTKELATLRAIYPTSGLPGCIEALPGRTSRAIYGMAGTLKLLAPVTERRGAPYQRWTTTPHIDAAIVRTYQTNPTKGAVKQLGHSINRPRSWIRARATQLGCAVPRFKEPPWSDKEKEIVATHATKSPEIIARILVRAGHKRTATAVAVQRKRLGISSIDPDNYTARGVGTLMGVDGKTVLGWIEKGWLQASRRGTDRVAIQGGDMWLIRPAAVRAFVIDNVAAVDIRKCDKFWLVDLLANGGP